MADSHRSEPEPAVPLKKRSLFSKEVRVKVSDGAKALDFFSRGKEIFEEKLEEDRRKQEKRMARLERKRLSKSVELKEESPVEEKRRKVSAQNYTTENGYSFEESSNHEREGESASTRKEVAL
jgi:hypothetical protein